MSLNLEIVDSLDSVDESAWNALTSADDPFTEYTFLRILEESGSVGEGTGWMPAYALLRDETGALRGAVPLYAKTDSYGEFIFDFGWANAAMRAGLEYYPKLVAAVPFTPATGRRFLTRPGDEAAIDALALGLPAINERIHGSSAHVLFLTGDEADRVARPGSPFLRRTSHQFHWHNPGYRTFEDYLGALRAPVRKQVRKERSRPREQGFEFRTVTGLEMSEEEWDILPRLYRSTIRRKGGFAYLTDEFFRLVRERYAHRLIASFACIDRRTVAGAFGFFKGANLYGRYWGTTLDAEFLHFELCYYGLIEYAIEHKFALFEAGAQGEHKLKRGFLPQPIHSIHYFKHPGLAEAVREFLGREGAAVNEEMAYYDSHSPFRKV